MLLPMCILIVVGLGADAAPPPKLAAAPERVDSPQAAQTQASRREARLREAERRMWGPPPPGVRHDLLKLTLFPAKTEIYLREPLLMTAVLSNPTKESVPYDLSIRHRLHFYARLPGQEYFNCDLLPITATRHYRQRRVYLQPNESLVWDRTLHVHVTPVGDPEDRNRGPDEEMLLFAFPREGRYEVTVRAIDMESVPVEILVKRLPEKHAEAMDMMLDEDLKWLFSDPALYKRFDEILGKAEKLIQIDPDGPYADFARFRLGEYYPDMPMKPDGTPYSYSDPIHIPYIVRAYEHLEAISNKNRALQWRAAFLQVRLANRLPELRAKREDAELKRRLADFEASGTPMPSPTGGNRRKNPKPQ